MELFEDRKLTKPIGCPLGSLVSPGVVTRWGRVFTRAVVGGVDTERCDFRKVRMLASGALNFGWMTGGAKIELLQVLLADDLLRPHTDLNALAWIWRLATWDGLDSLRFECLFETAYGTVGGTTLVIATENPTTMWRRAEINDGLPSRYTELDMAELVTGTPAGVVITLPSLTRGEHCQMHFVVAWRSGSPQCARGSVVQLDLDPKHILDVAQAY